MMMMMMMKGHHDIYSKQSRHREPAAVWASGKHLQLQSRVFPPNWNIFVFIIVYRHDGIILPTKSTRSKWKQVRQQHWRMQIKRWLTQDALFVKLWKDIGKAGGVACFGSSPDHFTCISDVLTLDITGQMTKQFDRPALFFIWYAPSAHSTHQLTVSPSPEVVPLDGNYLLRWSNGFNFKIMCTTHTTVRPVSYRELNPEKNTNHCSVTSMTNCKPPKQNCFYY